MDEKLQLEETRGQSVQIEAKPKPSTGRDAKELSQDNGFSFECLQIY